MLFQRLRTWLANRRARKLETDIGKSGSDFNYFRCDWSHRNPDEPITLFYEVDAAGDVPRMIEVFGDGRHEARAIPDFMGRENELPGFNSLIEGSFYHDLKMGLQDGPDRIELTEVGRGEFNLLWRTHRGY